MQWNRENNRMGKTIDIFKKIRDTKGTFHPKMGSIKDRNGMDLTEAEDIKKRCPSQDILYKWNHIISSFCDFFFSLTYGFQDSSIIVAYVRTSFFMVEYSLIIWIYHILFIHWSVDISLSCFQFLAVMNNAAVNTDVQVFVLTYVFIHLVCTPRSGISGS